MIRLDTEVSFQTQPTSLNYLIEDIIKANLKPRAAEKGLAVNLVLHPDLPVIRANAGLLRQALLHLIDNALLYTDQGEITLRTAEEAQGIVIEVSDTGIGIAEEHLAHIFERFYKVDPARTAGRSGVGLGLAMVKKIVESHKGTVTVDSAPGQGSTFRLHLPLSQ
jgi:signal transduction histidine kinase